MNLGRDSLNVGVFWLLLLSSLLGYAKLPGTHLALYNFTHPLFAAILIVLNLDRAKEALRHHSRTFSLTMALYGWMWISALFSELRSTAIRFSAKYLIFVLVFLTFLILTHKYTQIQPSLDRAMLRFLILLGLLGLAEYFYPHYWTFLLLRSPESLAVYPRISSLMQGPNQFGTLMSVGLFLALLLYKEKSISSAVAYSSMPLFLLVISLSGSRNAWLVFILGMLLAWIYQAIKIKWAILLTASLAFFLSLIPLAATRVVIESNLTVTSERISFDMAPRLLLWKAALREIPKKPLTGIGIQVFGKRIGKEVVGSEDYHAHNIFLSIAAEIGLPGLLLFVLLIWSIQTRVDFHKPMIVIPLMMVFSSQLLDYYMHDYTFTPIALYFVAEAANSRDQAD